ncbi:zinc finger, CCHC-type containing protein [Tanacetum coccineum]
MGDENPIRTLGDYSKPSHKGYRNTIELPVGNNVVPLRSDTIRLVQNGCSFHGLWSEDPNQHLKDFLKLVDSLDLDGDNRKRTRLCLFQFSLHDQASNWLERLPAGSITTWEDLTTRFLAQFFLAGRTAKLRNDILMFEQHHRESLSEAWTRQQQDDMIGKINLLWKTIFEKLNDASFLENTGNSKAPKIIAAISHDEREELKKKGIKSPSKLLSPKYLSPASIKELNKNPSSLKRVYFVNSIVILSTDSDTEEEDVSSTNACGLNLGGMLKGKEGVKEQGNEENEMETDMEVDEVIEEEESEFETDEEIEEILEEEEDDEDGSFAYECDFMILEDTSSIIDCHLGEMVFGKPFINEISLVYNEEEGTVMFKQDDQKITFKMPHTMEIFKQTRLVGFSTDSIPPSAYEENFGHGRTRYYQSLLIRDEYKQDGGDRRGIRHLMRLERDMMDNKG